MRVSVASLLVAVALTAVTANAQVKITQGSDRVMVEIDGKPFTALFTSSSATKPYLHPVRAASGKIVSRVWPMEEKEGEAKDHIHHRGLWSRTATSTASTSGLTMLLK